MKISKLIFHFYPISLLQIFSKIDSMVKNHSELANFQDAVMNTSFKTRN